MFSLTEICGTFPFLYPYVKVFILPMPPALFLFPAPSVFISSAAPFDKKQKPVYHIDG